MPRTPNLPAPKLNFPWEYALVSVLPGTDRRHQLLIVSGLNTQTTLMGIEFLTDQARVKS